jgi:hypothetical protein
VAGYGFAYNPPYALSTTIIRQPGPVPFQGVVGVRAIGDAVQLRQQRCHLPGYGRRPCLACEGIDGKFDNGFFRQAGGASQPFDLCDNNRICDLQCNAM